MLTWTHYDPNLPQSVDDGMAMLRAGDFTIGPTTAQLRGLQAVLTLKAVIIGHLLGTATYSTDSTGDSQGDIAGNLSVPGERGDAARALVAPVVVYYSLAGLPALDDYGTYESVAPADVGVWPLAVIIVVGIAGAAVLGWGMQKGTELVKFFHTQNTQVSEIQKLDARVTDVLNKHVQVERDTKQVIPLSPAEKQVVADLNARIAQLQGQLTQPTSPGILSSVPWYAWAIGGAAVLGIGALAVRNSPARAAA